MSKYSIKKQEKVLKTLIKLAEQSPARYIYRPKDFESNFKFVSTETLIAILELLEHKQLIEATYADLPDNFNIDTIYITPNGFDYAPQKALKTKERWLERLYGFVAGTILGSVTTYMITYTLTQFLVE